MRKLNSLAFAASLFYVFGLYACGNKSPEQTSPPAADSTVSTPDSTTAAVEQSPAETPSQPEGATGIDVSHFNGEVNWNDVKAAGIDFAYSKATQGMGYVDPKFNVNEVASGKVGIPHGAYHFFVASDDPKKQASFFIENVKKLDDGTLPPVLDLEQGGVSGKVDPKTFQANVLTWLNMVEEALQVKPIIYTNTPFSNQYLNQEAFAAYKLWIAEYGVREPRIPKTWASSGWFIWQRTDASKIKGIPSSFDQDTLAGHMGMLSVK